LLVYLSEYVLNMDFSATTFSQSLAGQFRNRLTNINQMTILAQTLPACLATQSRELPSILCQSQ
ncbi:MAG: hypothetical protein AB2693_32570, partial [Candidatus Thiodiazotropha sp.]